MLVIPQGYPRRIAHIDPNYNAVREMRGVSKLAEPVILPAESPNVHAPRLQRHPQRPQRAGDRRNPDRHLERGDRRHRLHAGRRPRNTAPTRSMSARRRRRSWRRQAAGDLRRHRRPMGRGLGGTARIRRTARRAGHHQPRRQELLPGEPSAVAGFRRQRGAEAGASLRAERRRHHRHRLLVHRDQFRHQVPQGQDLHPRDPRSQPPQQGRRQRGRPGRRCEADAGGADRRTAPDHQGQPRPRRRGRRDHRGARGVDGGVEPAAELQRGARSARTG